MEISIISVIKNLFLFRWEFNFFFSSSLILIEKQKLILEGRIYEDARYWLDIFALLELMRRGKHLSKSGKEYKSSNRRVFRSRVCWTIFWSTSRDDEGTFYTWRTIVGKTSRKGDFRRLKPSLPLFHNWSSTSRRSITDVPCFACFQV